MPLRRLRPLWRPLIALLAASCLSSPALATRVQTEPMAYPSTSTAVVITTHAVFQVILAANPNRKGCLIQNTSADTERVYFGPNGSATSGASVKLIAGNALTCAGFVILPSDNISITSDVTDGATAVVISQ